MRYIDYANVMSFSEKVMSLYVTALDRCLSKFNDTIFDIFVFVFSLFFFFKFLADACSFNAGESIRRDSRAFADANFTSNILGLVNLPVSSTQLAASPRAESSGKMSSK